MGYYDECASFLGICDSIWFDLADYIYIKEIRS